MRVVIRRPASGRRQVTVLLLSGAGLLAWGTIGCRRGHRGSPEARVSYAEARALVDRHCVSCHSEQPTIPAFPIAPAGVMLDSAEQMHQYAERIKARTLDKTMPLLNKTGMTEEEREKLRRWIDAGAKTP